MLLSMHCSIRNKSSTTPFTLLFPSFYRMHTMPQCEQLLVIWHSEIFWPLGAELKGVTYLTGSGVRLDISVAICHPQGGVLLTSIIMVHLCFMSSIVWVSAHDCHGATACNTTDQWAQVCGMWLRLLDGRGRSYASVSRYRSSCSLYNYTSFKFLWVPFHELNTHSHYGVVIWKICQ